MSGSLYILRIVGLSIITLTVIDLIITSGAI
jgi:hypothetical protein